MINQYRPKQARINSNKILKFYRELDHDTYIKFSHKTLPEQDHDIFESSQKLTRLINISKVLKKLARQVISLGIKIKYSEVLKNNT